MSSFASYLPAGRLQILLLGAVYQQKETGIVISTE
jgi:hypothetical protein